LIKRNPEALSNCLLKFRKSWSDIDNLINLSNNWAKVVGKELANECKPLKIENNILTIVANHPQWRQALIYNKHKLKESILGLGIKLRNIRIVQNYPTESIKDKISNNTFIWENHPSRIKNQQILNCKICERPTPKREIERWGKCTFCWRETI
tara:strand:- start:1807 stop:2265 length:459 start_codon:yes stop_codon:yes gene_type:complete